jgi:hypothetical protein
MKRLLAIFVVVAVVAVITTLFAGCSSSNEFRVDLEKQELVPESSLKYVTVMSRSEVVLDTFFDYTDKPFELSKLPENDTIIISNDGGDRGPFQITCYTDANGRIVEYVDF